MKKRLLAMLLVVVTLISVLGIGSFAAESRSLASYITKSVTNATGEVLIVVDTDVYVNEALTIPKNVKISITAGHTLTVNARLVVLGTLNVGSNQLSVGAEGSVIYPKCPYCLDSGVYCIYCGRGFNNGSNTSMPTNIPCSIHTTVNKYYCALCKEVYCAICAGGVHAYNSLTGKCSIVNNNNNGYYFTCPKCSRPMTYCSNCNSFYCVSCAGGVHVYNPITKKCDIKSTVVDPSAKTCPVHGTEYRYCEICKVKYCTLCNGGYYHQTINGKCYITNGSSVNPVNPVNPGEGSYVYIPGYGFVFINNYNIVSTPVPSIENGSSVPVGTKLTLSTSSINATIYYAFEENGRILGYNRMYSGEQITLNATTIIHAYAVMPSGIRSNEVVLKYTVYKNAEPAKPSDTKADEKLNAVIKEFIEDKVLPAKFDSKTTVTYDMVVDAMTALGMDPELAKLNKNFFKDLEKLTNEDLIYACYRIMRTNEVIEKAEGKSAVLMKAMKYQKEASTLSRYKIAYASFIESEVLSDWSFKPQDKASAVIFVNILDWAKNAQ